MTRPLTRRRLEWLVRARGTDLAAWPDADRAAAVLLLRRSAEAREAFAQALTEEDAPDVDLSVLERMQLALRRSLAPLPLLWRGVRAGALLACVAAGLYLGTNLADPEGSADPFASVQTVSIASLDP